MEQIKKEPDIFWENLWKVLEENAKGLDPVEVIKAFKKVSDDICSAGIDKAYEQTVKKVEVKDINFDLAWMTLLAVRLKELRKQL